MRGPRNHFLQTRPTNAQISRRFFWHWSIACLCFDAISIPISGGAERVCGCFLTHINCHIGTTRPHVWHRIRSRGTLQPFAPLCCRTAYQNTRNRRERWPKSHCVIMSQAGTNTIGDFHIETTALPNHYHCTLTKRMFCPATERVFNHHAQSQKRAESFTLTFI